MCLYAARRVPEISDNVLDVDRALRWGFAWELGPFEIMDAIGVKAFAGQVQKEGRALPAVIEKVLSSDERGFTNPIGASPRFSISAAARRKKLKSPRASSSSNRSKMPAARWNAIPVRA